jgi:hypothetical protein
MEFEEVINIGDKVRIKSNPNGQVMIVENFEERWENDDSSIIGTSLKKNYNNVVCIWWTSPTIKESKIFPINSLIKIVL